MNTKEVKGKIISVLKRIYDPEIPVDIYELGLIYKVDLDENGIANIEMTLTSPNCPVADSIVNEVFVKIKEIEEIKDVEIHLTFNPPWDSSMASEVAQLQLGIL